MQCPICRGPEKWTNVDEFRIKPEGMSICETCGFVSYPNRYKTKEEILKYYETDYRKSPSAPNIFTGERKLHYHAHFLQEVIAAWKNEGRKPVFTDVGAAIGMTLNWFRSHFPEADINGVELTKTFVRNAFHLFGVNLKNDFDDSKEYDLILSYKTLEHILDPDVELRRYIKALKEDGYLYISVPFWFKTMTNFGLGGFNLEFYYSPDHINTWTERHFTGLVKSCGGEIVKTNRTMYGDSYLIMRNDELLSSNREECYEDPDIIKQCLNKIFIANEAYETAQYSKALATWENFPTGWATFYESRRKEMHAMGFEKIKTEFIDKMFAACPNEADCYRVAADIAMRYEEYEDALSYLKKRHEMQPNGSDNFVMLASCFREMSKRAKTAQDAINFLKEAVRCSEILKQTSSQSFAESMNWIMLDNSKIPTPFETTA